MLSDFNEANLFNEIEKEFNTLNEYSKIVIGHAKNKRKKNGLAKPSDDESKMLKEIETLRDSLEQIK